MGHQQRRTALRPLTVNAHRGYSSRYPENTLLAFEKAIEIGADYVELDVRLSKDGVLVVSHDASLERCGKSDLRTNKNTLAELQKVNLGQGQTIPTLEDVLRLCKGNVGIHLEIKEFGLSQMIGRMIREHRMIDDVIISSFKYVELLRIKDFIPDILCAITEPSESYEGASPTIIEDTFLYKARMCKAAGIHVNQSYLTEDLVENAHEAGLYLDVWNVDSPYIWDACVEMGVDGIFTNDAGGLIQFLDNSKQAKK